MSNKKLNPKALAIFDLDGTMVDSAPDLAASVAYMLSEMGRAPCSEQQVRSYVGNGAQRLIERALTASMDGKPEQGEYQQAQTLFFAHYADNVCRKSKLYPGTLQALQWLDGRGCALVCVTNKPEVFTLPLLDILEVRKYFKLVISGDTLPQKKPHPLPLTHAAEQLDISIEQSVMIGDSSHDVAAAKAAGMNSIAVTYGYNHGSDISLSEPDIVIDNLQQLETLIEVAG